MTLKTQTRKEKIDKLGFNKIKGFSASKVTIKRMNRQHTKSEKIFANHMPDWD